MRDENIEIETKKEVKDSSEEIKYKEIMVGRLNYFDLNPTEKNWYLHLKKSRRNSSSDLVIPILETGLRVWHKGKLFEVSEKDGWEITLYEINTEFKFTVKEQDIDYSPSADYNKKKLKFVLDDMNQEEIGRVSEVLSNEAEVKKQEMSKGKRGLEFKKGTIGEKINEVISKFSGSLRFYARSEPYGDALIRVVFKNREEKIEINWDDFPRDRRQEFINLNLKKHVDHINDYFETRYIYMKSSLKEYVKN